MHPDQKAHYDAILVEIQRGDYDFVDVQDKVVLDIGAYFGETAEHFVEKGAKLVYALEPFSSVEAIPITDKIKPIRAGFSDTDKFVPVDYSFNVGSTRLSDRISEEGQEIVVYSLATLVAMFGIYDGVLKLDIEGDERLLLEANMETLQKFSAMIIEVHDNIDPTIGLELLMFLTENGFQVVRVPHGPNVSMIYAILIKGIDRWLN